MALNITPLADYVVVEQEEAEAKTASGLYLPDKAQEKPKIAKILAVGPGRTTDDGKKIKPEVKVGDRIVYGGYSNTEIKLEGKEYILVKEENIYAIVK